MQRLGACFVSQLIVGSALRCHVLCRVLEMPLAVLEDLPCRVHVVRAFPVRGLKHIVLHFVHLSVTNLIVIHAVPDGALVVDRGHQSLRLLVLHLQRRDDAPVHCVAGVGRDLWKDKYILTGAIPAELHRKDAFLQRPDLFDIVRVLHYLGHDGLDLVDLRQLVRLQEQVVALLDGTDDLGHGQLGGHELFEAFLRLVDPGDLLAILICLVERPCELLLLLLAES